MPLAELSLGAGYKRPTKSKGNPLKDVNNKKNLYIERPPFYFSYNSYVYINSLSPLAFSLQVVEIIFLTLIRFAWMVVLD